MTTQDNFGIAMPTQDQRDIVRLSSETCSPPPTRGSSLNSIPIRGPLEHPSPSLPPSSPFWDQMLPSSPSPKPHPDVSMNLDRFVERGFSEDLALPPRQIEKPFRFLYLPAEIRNMIYQLVFDENRTELLGEGGCHCGWCDDDVCHGYIRLMKSQWRPPQLGFVSKRLRQETMSLYYAVTDFYWYWDPLRVFCECGRHSLLGSIGFLSDALDFITSHHLQIRSITLRGPNPCYRPSYSLAAIVNFVHLLATLWRLADQTGKGHVTLREIKFAKTDSMTRRLSDLAVSLEPWELDDDRHLTLEVRLFLHHDHEGFKIISVIEDMEDDEVYFYRELAKKDRKRLRDENKAKGPERWGGVLRNRQDEEADKTTVPERWDSALRGRAAKGKK
ncbi:hypothetical protein D6D19_03937 [Aureobasidium pullulans]|uniref:Uncharacterized protein n=1 Tax=Aureobasidium pullulans TaxID=5580 RepID=A0A4S9A8Q7_AURPU|nr:hypothetical protein D6D19_03937 [Aureobasidium pullulans]